MIYIFILAAFVCGFLSYRTGFADGQAVANGGKIKSLKPRKTTVSAEEERIAKGMSNILNYANRKTKGGINHE